MSEATAQYSDRLNLAELVARIERQQAETRKFVAEHDKLASEREKLAAEAEKFHRDRFLAPILAAGAVAGGVAAIIPIVLGAWGVH